MFGDSRPHADLQSTSNNKLGLGKIDDIVLRLFSDITQSEIWSIAAIPRYEQAKSFRDQLFYLSVVKDYESFGRDKLLSCVHFAALFNATKTRFAIIFANSVLPIKKETKKNRYYSIPNSILFQNSLKRGLCWWRGEYWRENDRNYMIKRCCLPESPSKCSQTMTWMQINDGKLERLRMSVSKKIFKDKLTISV
jgi:hypothetical protein